MRFFCPTSFHQLWKSVWNWIRYWKTKLTMCNLYKLYKVLLPLVSIWIVENKPLSHGNQYFYFYSNSVVVNHLKCEASSRWSFRPNSAWGGIETIYTMTCLKIKLFLRRRLEVVQVLDKELLQLKFPKIKHQMTIHRNKEKNYLSEY